MTSLNDTQRRASKITLVVCAAVLLSIACCFTVTGCYAVPKHDDPYTDFDEASEETVVAGVGVYDQPAGTGAPLSGDAEGGGWGADEWLNFGLTSLLTLATGNAGLAVATKRGRSNIINFFARRSSVGSKVASAAAIVLPTDSPPEAKAITVEVAKEKAQAEVKAAKAA